MIKQKISKIVQDSPGLLIINRKFALDYMWSILEPIHTILKREAMVVIYLDNDNKIINTDLVLGAENSVLYPPKEILKKCIEKNATKIIVGHNHPEDFSAPSDEDVYHCATLYLLLWPAGIKLLDDLVVCRNQLKSIINTLRFKQMVKIY